MVLALAPNTQTKTVNETAEDFLPEVNEFVVYCPGCKTLEMLWFNGSRLMQTRKFNQQGTHVYHDCGTAGPCRLFRPR